MDPVSMLMIGSTVLSAGSTLASGKAANKAAKYEAAQLERNAKARYAQGTREAYEARREGDIVASNARAAMASMGGTTTDPGALDTLSRIKREADYNALSALYGAQTDADAIKAQAAGRRWEGKVAKQESQRKALSTVLSGASSVWGSFPKNDEMSFYKKNLRSNRRYGWDSGVG